MTYTRKTLSEIKLIHGNYGNFIKGQKLPKDKEKKYKMPPYKDLAESNEIDGEPLNEKCWPGYEKKGMKTMFGKRYPNCVKKKKTRKEEYSDWRSELEENKEIDEARNIVKKFGKKTSPKGALATKTLTKLGTKGRIAAVVLGGALAAPTIVSGIKGLIKRRKNAAIEKQVDKYVSDRKAPIKKVDYMPDNMYTVKRDKGGKVSGTGDKIRVVPGTRTTPKPTQPDNTKKSRFSQHTKMKLGNYGSLSPYDDAIDKQVDKYVKDRKVPIRKIKEEKKMTKAQIKKRDEIADAISTREMNKRYGDKNVKYAIATKLAMKEDNIQEILDKKDVPHIKKLIKKLKDGSELHAKQSKDLEVALNTENTAIESELVIQDWNKDDIKFTEIETIDIIKAKPLKESMSNWREDLGEDWQKVNRQDKTDGLSKKAVKAYRRENPGSK